MATSTVYSSYGRPLKTTEKGFTPIHLSRHSPPLPPPPPPESGPPPVSIETNINKPNSAGVRGLTKGVVTPSAPSFPAPDPPFPPPPSFNPPLPPSTLKHAEQNPALSSLSNPSVSTVTSLSLLSQQNPQVTSSSGIGYGSPARQPSKPPPPPPPPPQAPWNQPEEDYGTEDDTK